jgi:DNA-binding transcriptional MerR regulator
LPRLNSILALKELGLSLEQIGPLLEKDLSPTELRSMLTLKRAQLERSLQETFAPSRVRLQAYHSRGHRYLLVRTI